MDVRKVLDIKLDINEDNILIKEKNLFKEYDEDPFDNHKQRLETIFGNEEVNLEIIVQKEKDSQGEFKILLDKNSTSMYLSASYLSYILWKNDKELVEDILGEYGFYENEGDTNLRYIR